MQLFADARGVIASLLDALAVALFPIVSTPEIGVYAPRMGQALRRQPSSRRGGTPKHREGLLTEVADGMFSRRLMGRSLSFLLSLLLAVVLALAAHAEEGKTLKGVALVIGQSKYVHIMPLANPANDARAMSKLLTDMGFDARSVSDR